MAQAVAPKGDLLRRVGVAVLLLPGVLWLVYHSMTTFTFLVIAVELIMIAEIDVMVVKAQARDKFKVEVVLATAYATAGVVALLLIRQDFGPGAILFALAIAFGGDTLALLGGRAFGTRPLAPSISPNKTVEGALFGLVGSLFVATVVASLWFHKLNDSGVMIVLLAAVVGQAGDLFESWVKRRFDVKDSSGLLGAHGGMFDRIDALLAVAMVVFVGLKLG